MPEQQGNHNEEGAVQPPHSIEYEQAVIGSALINSKTLLDTSRILKPDDFYRPAHQEIWKVILDLWECMRPVDIVTTSESLKEKQKLDLIGGRQYVTDLAMSIATTANADFYAKRIKNFSNRRQLIKLTRKYARETFEEEDIELTIASLVRETQKIEEVDTRHGAPTLAEIIPETMKELDRRMENKGCLTGVPSGIFDLDEKILGFQAGDFVIIGARPSMGKTALALNFAYAQAREYNLRSLFFSLEMYKEELSLRLLAAAATFDAKRFKTGQIDPWERRETLDPASEVLKQLPIHIVDQKDGIKTVQDVVAKIDEMFIRGILPDVVYVDYLQLLQSQKDSGNRELEVSDISRTLKQTAAKYGIAIVALCQLSRAVEARQNKRPMLGDLRESGSLEQDASIVIFIYRDEWYNPETNSKGEAELIIAKNRQGECCTVHTLYRGNKQQFVSKGGDGQMMKLLPKEKPEELPDLLSPYEIEKLLTEWEKEGGTDHVEIRLHQYVGELQGNNTVTQFRFRNWTALSEKWEQIKAKRISIAMQQKHGDLHVFYE